MFNIRLIKLFELKIVQTALSGGGWGGYFWGWWAFVIMRANHHAFGIGARAMFNIVCYTVLT